VAEIARHTKAVRDVGSPQLSAERHRTRSRRRA
jgi:hypothetical protein